MRPQIPMYWIESREPFCRLVGTRHQRIECGSALLPLVTRPQLTAFIGHELGHRNLYHIERVYLLTGAAIAAALYLLAVAQEPLDFLYVLLAYAGGVGFAHFARLVWHEFEADLYTLAHFPPTDYYNATMAVLKHYGRPPGRVMRWRLALMKGAAKIP